MKSKSTSLIPAVILLAAGTLCGQTPDYGRFIDRYARSHSFSGTIMIEDKTKIRYARSFGYANRQFRVPNTIKTRFKIASITKAFTAVLILRLHEQRKISLDQTIRTYLPNYTGSAGDKVTIKQLLNHTAGMANIDRQLTSAEAAIKNGIPHYQTPLTTDQLLARYCSDNLVNEPGKVFDYNNADYIILGKIIERVYGEPYEQVLRKEILQPAGLRDTGMLYQHDVIDNLADTYFFREDLKRVVNDLPVYIENWYAAGAMYSTAADVLKFSNALFGLKIIGREALSQMLTPGLDDYGYGVWVYEATIKGSKRTVVKRPGRIMGAQSMLFHLPNDDITIVLLSNTDSTPLDEFAAELAKRVVP
jgi:D-alanyl-D-alanine carboxypeptidase